MLTSEQRIAVVNEAMTWIKTPYHHRGNIKHVGVDCGMFPVEVYHAAGVMAEKINLGDYSAEWHLHQFDELYQAHVKKYCDEIFTKPQAGDFALFKYGHTMSHGAIFISETEVIHSYIRRGVVISRLTDEPIAGRPMQVWAVR
jgi:cell wall-associated NlpC family hydrolase